MKFIDLEKQREMLNGDIELRIEKVISSNKFIMGNEVTELEKLLADYVGVKHAISCGSGTDALVIALMAVGVSEYDIVYTTPFTFIATAEAIKRVGATVKFIDIDSTFNICPVALEKAIKEDMNNALSSLRPAYIIPVDLFGLPANYEKIINIAAKNELLVINDCAQSFGATFKGINTCGIADIGCTSFFPTKPLGCYGDGGMCFTDNDKYADTMRSVRTHGTLKGDKRYFVRHGINSRLDTIQAAILLSKMESFNLERQQRQTIADYYRLKFEGTYIITPKTSSQSVSAWAHYTIALSLENKIKVKEALIKEDIPFMEYYTTPLHKQAVFFYENCHLPKAEYWSSRTISLPIHPYLTYEDQCEIINAILSVVG